MSSPSDLTEREREILALLASGASNKEIAQKLFITANTVKVHLRNIFAKIGVNSRTEAAIYALREEKPTEKAESAAAGASQSGEETPPPPKAASRSIFLGLALTALTALLAGSVSIYLWFSRPPAPAASPAPAPTPQRWQALADLPTARSGLAVAVYENQIYAIAGETDSEITGVVEQYDISTNTWAALPAKPTPVTDIGAALIGGKIYVPGGRLASGAISATLEVYDPLQKRWETRAPMLTAISAYALAAFEGKLYLFGGWDGQKDLASVYEYDPAGDQWTQKTPMPTARSFAGAAVAGGKIYVVGGAAGGQALAVNEEYIPERDDWQKQAPMPQPRSALGITSIADTIYVVGGSEQHAAGLPPLRYSHQQNQWQEFENPQAQNWSHFGLVSFQTHLYGVGGLEAQTPSAKNLSYQAIYIILIPSIQ
ncbi:MAG: kelch repeat-containing protein [Anaerolineales bacterium]